MTPEQAILLRDMMTADAEGEAATTRKVIAAMPAGKEDYAPDAKNMKAIDLAFHIVQSEIWFLEGIVAGEFPMENAPLPDTMKTGADVVAWYDARFQPAMDKVKALSGEKAAVPVSFFGMMTAPVITYLNFLIKHSVHHRGQLSAYLRPMGGKVPSIYGGSADEPFEMPS